jgi:hypothetical protein
MTDRELLELAAKAAGIGHPSGDHTIANDGRLWDYKELRWWNPLTDDGDALRLAVKLDIVPRRINNVLFAWRDGVCDIQEPHNGDPYAATRRAIVRAAAEIGEGIIQPRSENDLPEDNYYKTMAEAEEIGRNQS